MTAIITGTLALNMTLFGVAETRTNQPTAWPLTHDPLAYDCLVGLPYGHGRLIDTEVYFVSDGTIYGPWLVVDVESERHAPYMIDNGLAADINCEEMVHRSGKVWGVE